MPQWLARLLGLQMKSPSPESPTAGMVSPLQQPPDYSAYWGNAPTPTPTQMPMPTATPAPMRPMPTPTPIQEVAGLHPGSLQAEIARQILERFPKTEGYNPVNLAFRESSLSPEKVGPVGERGLFQIYEPTFYGEDIPGKFGYSYDQMFNVPENIRVAKWLYDQYGYMPWAASRGLGLIK